VRLRILNYCNVPKPIIDVQVMLENEQRNYRVQVVDSEGIFGLQLPSELSLLLNYYPEESKQLVRDARKWKNEFESSANPG